MMSTNDNVSNASETATVAQNSDTATRKAQLIARWRSLEPNQDPLPFMNAIPYGTKGSRFGCSGIRIEGDQEFIDSVLSNLQTLLNGETAQTRIDISMMNVKPQEGFKAGENAYSDAKVCYIRLGERSLNKRGRPKGSKNRPKNIIVAEPKNAEPPQNETEPPQNVDTVNDTNVDTNVESVA